MIWSQKTLHKLLNCLWSGTWQSEAQQRFWTETIRGKIHPARALLAAFLCATADKDKLLGRNNLGEKLCWLVLVLLRAERFNLF